MIPERRISSLELSANQSPYYRAAFSELTEDIFYCDALSAAHIFLTQWPGFKTTPLVELDPGGNRRCVKNLLLKDEGDRLGLGSFKTLGGAYAVSMAVWEQIGSKSSPMSTLSELRRLASTNKSSDAPLSVICASAGNHGVGVASAAGSLGVACCVVLPAATPIEHEKKIAALGAEVVRISGNYEAAAAAARRRAETTGAQLISDAGEDWCDRSTVNVMRSYSLLADETKEQCVARNREPTHIFLQCGVGTFASTMAYHFAKLNTKIRPKIILVEPEGANCLQESLAAGERREIGIEKPSSASMLDCGAPALFAWDILGRAADFAASVTEEDIDEAVSYLNTQACNPPSASGAAGVAGFLKLCGNRAWAHAVGLNKDSVVLVFLTEKLSEPK